MKDKISLDINKNYETNYCIDLWLRDEQVKLSTARIKARIQYTREKRSEPIAIACFGPSLRDTWENIKKFKYIITCSGAHKFLIERGIIPTWHCLPHYAIIETEDGPKTIKWIVDNKYAGKVKSLRNNDFVWNKIINHWSRKNLDKKWVSVRSDSIKKLICTDDHKIAVIDDVMMPNVYYISAKESIGKFSVRETKPGRENPLFNREQLSVLIGTILGDATINKYDATVHIGHCTKQKKYVELKQSLLSGSITDIIYNKFGKQHLSHILNCGANSQTKYLRKIMYQENIKTPKNVLQYIDECSLAFWYMDDGNLNSSKNRRPRARLYTMGFRDEDQKLLCDFFQNKWNIKPTIVNHKRKNGKVYKYLRFGANDSEKFFDLISKYVIESMEYKLPPKWRGGLKHTFQCNSLNYSASLIEDIKYLNNDASRSHSKLYDIEVENDHNFIANGAVVHNCEVDPRSHKTSLIGTPHKDVEYLIASTCHPKLFDLLEGYNVKLWHIFANDDDAYRMLPYGEWALTGGSSAGLRSLIMARFLGFTDLHVFGMDGNFESTAVQHASNHPMQAPESFPVEYDGVTYYTTQAFLEPAKQTFYELDQMPDVKATFYGNGLVQHMAKNYKPNPNYKSILAFNKRELISQEYKELNMKLHNSDPKYGTTGRYCVGAVLKLSEILKTTSILDYGSGKGLLAKGLPFPIWEFDPAIPGKDMPPRPADLVVCTDVLEHIEPDKLMYVLADIHYCMKKRGFFVINIGPAIKKYSNGRNTHLIQKDKEWWEKKLKKFFIIEEISMDDKNTELHVLVKPLDNITKNLNIENDKPLVSIIIPTYNHLEDYLKPCIESIKTYTDLHDIEVIVVANGCTDGTEEYLKTLLAPFNYIISEEPLGFTAAVNDGIAVAKGDYIVLLNNDTILLHQEKHAWINALLEPFRKDEKVGITGPVKFNWDCGGVKRRAMAFWCVMIHKKLFQELGLLDEIFSPGMGEDGDFSIKTELAGYKLIQVPIDKSEEFGKGIPDQSFPIYHKGSGTFGEKDYSEITKRNAQILVDRYGPYGPLKTSDRLEEIYNICLKHESDTNQLFPIFRSYAGICNHITEFGVRGVFSTWAFLASRPDKMISYDIEYSPNIEEAKNEATKACIDFAFIKDDVLKIKIETTDLLFIDTKHTYAQLKEELRLHAPRVNMYILIHDTTSFGDIGEDDGPGEWLAIEEFLATHKDWILKERLTISNGLTILERTSKYEIPLTYNERFNIPNFDDTPYKDEFQNEVYSKARDVYNYNNLKSIIDVGCGSAFKLFKYFNDIPFTGVEIDPTYNWLCQQYPNNKWERYRDNTLNADLVICADILEHLEDPDEMMAYIKKLNSKYIVLSTPDKDLGNIPNGPPANVHHVREWSFNEFEKYVSRHFDILEHFYSNKVQGTQCIVCVPKNNIKYSIIIPTCGKDYENVLKVCLEAVCSYTDLNDKEIIVVANGCSQEAINYLKTRPVKLLEFPERIGYIKAVNAGIKIAYGEYIITLDDDSFLQLQATDQWIETLHKPFSDKSMAGSSPFAQVYDDLGLVLHSGCTMYKKSALHKIELFDEAFNPGYMGDEDLAIRLRKAGFKLAEVPEGQIKEYKNGTFQIQFPVVHTGTINTMEKYGSDLPLVKRNRDLLYERHKEKLTFENWLKS